MDKSPLPQRGTAWQTARGCAAVWVPSPSLLVVSLQGYGEVEFASPILQAYGTLRKDVPAHLFFDAEALANYESALRSDLTARFLPDRKRIAALHVLVRSRIVAMGVSVANLALGGLVTSSADRHRFKALLDDHLFTHRVVGFSSSAIDVLVPRSLGSRTSP